MQLLREHTYEGLNFTTLRLALAAIYWWKPDMEGDSWLRNGLQYVIPMQHNWSNPISAETHDTFIQYWIDRDDRLTQDYVDRVKQEVLKAADITIRFLGAQAEQWARAFHHLTKRQGIYDIFMDFCNGEALEYIGPIVPTNVDYFPSKTGNAAIAFDISFSVRYREYMDLSDLRRRLAYINLVPGELIEGSITGPIRGGE
jgi:hypothetical protein